MMEINGLSRLFDGTPAIADVSLTVEDDEYLTLLGPSGSGKSTLLRLIAGLERPDSGRIFLNNEDITFQPTHMRGLGFVQQNYALFPHMSVEDNVAFGLRNRSADQVADESEVQRRVGDMLGLVGLSDLGGRMVGQISGGQKQRVSLARTLVTAPKVCLLDEPLGALDANLRERMTLELRNIRETLGVTFVHATGNEAEALAMGDRMVVLDQGRAIQLDQPDIVFEQPATVAVARFVNAYNILPGEIRGGKFQHANARLSLPQGVTDAAHYVVRHDAADIEGPGTSVADGRASMEASFIASEFMGSRIIYIFKRPDGGVFEVERHLSRADPVEYGGGDICTLSWDVCDVLVFDDAGRLTRRTEARGAA